MNTETQSEDERKKKLNQKRQQAAALDRQHSGWHNPETQELIGGFRIDDTDTVVDVGCGRAGHTIFCSRYAKEVFFCDLNSEHVEDMTRRLAERDCCPHRGFVANAEALDLENGVATRVICNEVLEHVDEPSRVMDELVRIGKPGCQYLLTVPGEIGELVQKEIAPPQYFEKPNHIRVFSHDEFATLIEDSGLVIERWHHYGFYHALWWTLFWDDREALLDKWADLWLLLMENEKGRRIKAALDQVIPKTQMVLARKPG